MRNTQAVRVQHGPPRLLVFLDGNTVHVVPVDRRAYVLAMDSNLMSPPSLDLHPLQTQPLPPGQGFEPREGPLPPSLPGGWHHPHLLPVQGMPLDETLLRPDGGISEAYGQIDLGDASRAKLRGEGLQRVLVLGDEEDPAGALVQAMHDAGSLRVEEGGSEGGIPQVVAQGVHERSRSVSRGRVHDHSRGFVDGEEGVVFVEDGDGEVLPLERGRGRFFDTEAQGVAGFDQEGFFGDREGIEEDGVGGEELVDAGAG